MGMIPTIDFVKGKLLELNGELLKPEYKKLWSKSNPTFGYCYVVSEAMYHYLQADVKVYCMRVGEFGTHWYTVINNELIDYTGEQFQSKIDYSSAVRKGFFKGGVQTPKGYISKRGYEIAKVLELI